MLRIVVAVNCNVTLLLLQNCLALCTLPVATRFIQKFMKKESLRQGFHRVKYSAIRLLATRSGMFYLHGASFTPFVAVRLSKTGDGGA